MESITKRVSKKTIHITYAKLRTCKRIFDFYNKYKQPLFTGGQKGLSIDYQSFAEKNKENYYIFEKNWKRIQEANAILAKQNNSLQLGLNQYADTVDFDNDYNTDLMINTISRDDISPTTYFKFLQSPIPYIDGVFNKDKLRKYSWNDTDLLSPVKNQGQCGSCWAFSATTSWRLLCVFTIIV